MQKPFVLLLILSLLVCFRPQPQNSETVKIGVFLSLTGATASYGISALNAIKLATEEANRGGGIDGKQIELVVEDDHSKTDEVPGIVTKLSGTPGSVRQAARWTVGADTDAVLAEIGIDDEERATLREAGVV